MIKDTNEMSAMPPFSIRLHTMEFAVLLRLTIRPGLGLGGRSARLPFSEARPSWAAPELPPKAGVSQPQPGPSLRQFKRVLEDLALEENMPQQSGGSALRARMTDAIKRSR